MDSFQNNRQSWNELTALHAQSDFYDVAGFKRGASSLNAIELEELGDIKGKKILHLQCHFGLDTLSLARLGAEVTGVDISDASIATAQALAKELNIPATFIRSNVYDIEQVLDDTFDLVYTSYGAINWLNDLDAWARLIARYLKPNGVFYMVEFHPYIYTLGETGRIENSYFKTEPLESVVEESYTDNSKVVHGQLKHTEWHHSLSEVVNSLIASGLQLCHLNEFPFQVYNCFPNLREAEAGKWVFAKHGHKIPHMYSLKAVKR